jgi:IS5 family transposase
MLLMDFVQHRFNPAEFVCEEALNDSAGLRRFVGIDLGYGPVLNAMTLFKLWHLMETHKLSEHLFAEVRRVLQGSGVKLESGTVVDATIIGAPRSTKNEKKACDAEMHQTHKDRQ